MKIISLKFNKGKYEVVMDNGKLLTLDEDFIVKYRLVKDKEISFDTYKAMERELSYSTYYYRLLKYLNSYSKSKYEYSQYLEKIDTPKEYIKPIIDDLVNKKYINDERYAALAANHYINQGYGKKMIEYKLKEAHVDYEIINTTLAEINYEDLLNQAIKLANKRFKSLKADLDVKNRQKLFAYLLNHGYDYEIINNVISLITKND